MFNITDFLASVPLGFDQWNETAKLQYYQDNLETFDTLTNETQWQIVDTFSLSALQNIYDEVLGFAGPAANATATFLDVLTSWLTEGFTISDMDFTEATTQLPPVDACDQFDQNKAFFVLIMVPASVSILIILSFLQTRKYMNLKCCYARPSIVIPIDFVTPAKRRWASAAVFATMAYSILYLFEGQYYYRPSEYSDPAFVKNYGWTKVFVMMLNVIIVCITSYPLLACLTLRKSIPANIIGILYLSPWLAWQIMLWMQCPIIRNQDDEVDPGSLNFSTLLSYIFDIPMFICYFIIYVAYFIDLIINCRRCCCQYSKKKLELTGSYKYVQQLVNNTSVEAPTSALKKLLKKVQYSKVMGFRYSPRILCAVVVSFFTLFKLTIEINVGMVMVVDYLGSLVEDFYPLFEENNMTTLFDQVKEGVRISQIELTLAICLSFAVHVCFMVDIVLKYRHHVRKMFRGDYSWHYKYDSSPASYMVCAMRYGGYQVAYMLYGWLIFAFLLFVVLMLLTFLIIIPLRDGQRNFAINAIITLWPTIILSLAVYFVQLLACKFCFLQYNGRYLAFTNRRIYHIVDFFLFFYNVVLGFFSCLKRVLFSLVFGTLLISRLDKVLLMKGFERFDSGYKAYLGVLQVDIYHTHPVLNVFVKILENARHERQNNMLTPKLQMKRKYRNKWYRAYTLARNPSIVLERLQKEIKDKQQGKTKPSDDVIEAAGAVVSGFMGVTALNGIAQAADSISDINLEITPL